MTFGDLYHEAILWTCYLENFPDPERFLGIYRLSGKDRLLFDCLGRFFPFDEFYSRGKCSPDSRALHDLRLSNKPFLLPWIYSPAADRETLAGKQLLCPSPELFSLLDDKIGTKELFRRLQLPTPEATFVNKGAHMVEKPIRNSAGGLGIRLTRNNPLEGFFLEEYIEGCRSFGLHFFVYDEIEFLCADEMLYGGRNDERFIFSAQVNVRKDAFSQALIADCFKCIEYLRGMGYRGFSNIDVLAGEKGHYFLEINPRGGAFLPAFFAATSAGWTHFISHMREGVTEKGEIVLLDFGALKKVVRKLS